MTDITPVGISLPAEIISKIDMERGDIPRSRYILRILQDTYSQRKLKERTKSVGNIRTQDSPDREVGGLQSTESRNPLELINPTSQDIQPTEVNKNLCDGSGCNREATTEVKVNVGGQGTIGLNLCENCKPKFKQSIIKETSKLVRKPR